MSRLLLLVVLMCLSIALAAKAKKETGPDPKDCEVCIQNLEAIDATIPKDKKSDSKVIEAAINKYCTKSGAGSTWKPNESLTNPKDVKMCYYFEPIKKAVSQPFATGMPKLKVCQRLKKDNPEICDVRYPLKVEKTEGADGSASVDYNKLKVKELKTLLDQRGVKCSGCTEKADFIKKCKETEHLEM
jgi:hypothetical protein